MSSIYFIDETFSFYSENNPFSYLTLNTELNEPVSFNLFDTNFYQINLIESVIGSIFQEKVYTNHLKDKELCPICMEPEEKDGVLLECCQNKQFVCDECTDKMTKFSQINNQESIDLLIMTCPFCRKKVQVQSQE